MDLRISEGVNLDAQLVMTGRGCIIGQSGSGKSYLLSVITEELFRLNFPFCIIDTEGEYAALKESFSMVVVGGSDQDLPLETDFTKLFTRSVSDGVPVVLDLSDSIEKADIAYSALKSLYNVEEKLRTPYLVMIEEADKFAPQVVRPRINIVEELSVRGRKRGIGLIVATQRPSSISKNVLSQCSYGFIGKLTIENDLSAISQLFSSRSTLDTIVNLGTGEFVPFGIGRGDMIQVRHSTIRHSGSTPMISAREQMGSHGELNSLISDLRKTGRATVRKKAETVSSDTNIDSLPLRFTEEQAEAYAVRVSKKMFGIFGRQVETVDQIKLAYLPMRFCRIRIPAGKKREFDEYTMMVDRNSNVVQLSKDKSISIIRAKVAPAKLGKLESEVLDYVRGSKSSSISDMGEDGIAKVAAIRKAVDRLSEKGLITVKGESIRAASFANLLSKGSPATEEVTVRQDQVSGSAKSLADAKLLLGSMYPSASIVESSEVFLPVYEITLKHGNRVRVYNIDGVFGKELKVRS